MSDDFVEQMRDFCTGLPASFVMPPAWVFMMEAADRIEKLGAEKRLKDARIEELEAALREIGEKLSTDKYDNEHCLETVCGELARTALGKK
jgi:hypothetical protein